MNKLPNGWQIKTLSEVCSPSSSNIAFKDVKDKKGDYPIYGASGIVAYSNFYSKEKECIGIVKDGSVGKIFLLPAKSSVISTLNYLENFDNLDIKYLYYFLHCINFGQYIKGSVIPHIYFRDYKKEKIPLPPLAIQKQIAERLDYLFDKINKALTFLKENKEYIKKYRLSILKYAFEGKLTPSSKNWETKTLGEVCEITMGQSPNGKSIINVNRNINSKAIEFHQGKIYFSDKYILQSNVVTTDVKKIAKKNSILLCVRAPVGILNITQREIAIGRGLCALNSKFSNNDFLYFYLLTQKNYFNEKSAGSTFSAITLDIIKNTKIPLPPLETQKEIVSILDKKFKSMDEIERLNNENIENLLLLKKSLLKEAFSGKLI